MRRLLVLVLLAVLGTGCAEVQETADGIRGAADGARNAADSASKAANCAKIAADLAKLQVDRVSEPGRVEAAAQQLEERVRNIKSEDLRSATQKLADSAQAYATAVARGDTAAIERTRARVEQRARATAESCGVPVGTFLG